MNIGIHVGLCKWLTGYKPNGKEMAGPECLKILKKCQIQEIRLAKTFSIHAKVHESLKHTCGHLRTFVVPLHMGLFNIPKQGRCWNKRIKNNFRSTKINCSFCSVLYICLEHLFKPKYVLSFCSCHTSKRLILLRLLLLPTIDPSHPTPSSLPTPPHPHTPNWRVTYR